ncbi:MAG: EamA family transporter [Chloroflexi bacterium]|nr:EamA family transporter [Chloroflexota bacterium]
MTLVLIGISVFIHAGWNLLAHARRSDGMLLLRSSLITGAFGLLPVLFLELRGPAFPIQVWGLLALTGLCQAVYFFGLTKGYSSGDFTVVYPLARALPVLFLAFVDLARGRIPSPLGWAGMGLVVAGCALAPLESLRNATLARYRNRALLWALVTALGTVGYTAIDKIAAEALPPGPLSAARYGVLETIATVPFLWLALRMGGQRLLERTTAVKWRWAAVAALFIFGAYFLILWAYQLSPYASYISALRQFSIVIGVAVAAVILREPARLLRIGAALIIVAGIVCIAFAAS